MLTHEPKEYSQLQSLRRGVKVTVVNAGAEWMEDRIQARRAEGPPGRSAMFTAVMAGNNGREMAGDGSGNEYSSL